jgi:hypothetical protein
MSKRHRKNGSHTKAKKLSIEVDASLTAEPTTLYLWALCNVYSKQFPDPKQPVRSELVAAFTARVLRLLALQAFGGDLLKCAPQALTDAVHEAGLPLSSDLGKRECAHMFREMSTALIAEILELDTWLHEPGLDGCGEWLVIHGYSFETASKLIKKANSRRRGRPVSKRVIALGALEARRLEANRSWSSLASEFCKCDKLPHDELCNEALRKSVAELESVLEKYRKIPIPAEPLARLSELFSMPRLLS